MHEVYYVVLLHQKVEHGKREKYHKVELIHSSPNQSSKNTRTHIFL